MPKLWQSVALVGALLTPTCGWAQGSMQPEGKGRVIKSVIYSHSDKGFDDDGVSVDIADYDQLQVYVLAEYGLTKDLTLLLTPSYRDVQVQGGDSTSGLGYTDVGARFRLASTDTFTLAAQGLRTSQDYGAPQRIVEAVIAVNGERKRAMGRRVIRALDGDVHDRTVAMLGLTFKANTDDMRDSPAIDIVQAIQDAGGHVRAYDPQGMTHATYLMSGMTFCQSADEALRGSDAAAVATDWDDFRSLDLAMMKERLTTGIVVDLRNIYDPETMRAAGLNYTSVGR